MFLNMIDKIIKKKEFTIGESVIFRAKETIINTDYDYGVVCEKSDANKIQVLTRAGLLYVDSRDIFGVVLDSLLESQQLPIDIFLENINEGGLNEN